LVLAALIPQRLAQAFQAGTSTAVVGGKVQGKVVLDSDGSAVSGVTVTLVQISAIPRPAAASPINSGTVTVTPISASGGTAGTATTATTASETNGSFSVGDLAAGQFAVCVKDPNAAVIDPCLWTDSRTTVPVTAGNVSSGFVVRVKKASTVSVRVNDTAQTLAPKPTEAYPPHVLVGAFDARGGFHPAREAKERPRCLAWVALGVKECINEAPSSCHSLHSSVLRFG
jgi:hypothetical protein